MPERGNVYQTNVPNRLDRLPWSGFHWLVIFALGIAWILDGLEVTVVGSLSGALSESPTLHLTGSQVGAAASAYLIGAVGGRAVLRLADRPAGAQEAVHRDGAGLPGRHHRLRPVVEFLVVRVVPADHRRRHRRRVCRGERDDPGADPGPPARLHRPCGQRQLLDRRGDRRAGRLCGARPGDHAAGNRLARGLRHRRPARLHRSAPAPVPAGKPALADDARPAGGSRADGRARSRRGLQRETGRPLPPVPPGVPDPAHATCSPGSPPGRERWSRAIAARPGWESR